eukprot:6461720-Alexandrium_andersonii.AAC.1
MEGPSELAFQLPILHQQHPLMGSVHSLTSHQQRSMWESAAPGRDASTALPPPWVNGAGLLRGAW